MGKKYPKKIKKTLEKHAGHIKGVEFDFEKSQEYGYYLETYRFFAVSDLQYAINTLVTVGKNAGEFTVDLTEMTISQLQGPASWK